jgi:hypothetical protein
MYINRDTRKVYKGNTSIVLPTEVEVKKLTLDDKGNPTFNENGEPIYTVVTEIKDILYPRQIWEDRELLKSFNIYPYREVGVDSRYYWQGQGNIVDGETETVCTYEAIPKLLDDKLEFNEDGTPMLDSDGKQVVTKGLKSALKAKVSTKYKAIMERPAVDTGLGFSVDGGYADLQNFQIGKEFGLPQVKDVNGVFHDVTAEDYDTIIAAIKAKGLQLYNEKWLAEQEVEAISTLEELMAYENQISEGM